MLPTLSLQGSPISINILLYKLLSLRRLEYLAVDRQLNIQEISLKVQEFAEVPAAVKKGKDVRESFPELIGMEEILEDILEEKQPDFQLKSIMRILDDGTFLYLDLYIFGYIEELKSERLMLVYEDVTDSMAAHQSMVQHANENSIKLDYLATARDYIEKIINSLGDILLVTSGSGKIKKVNQSAQLLFGYSESELIGQPISMITAGEDLLRQVSQLDHALKSEYWHQVKVVCKTKTSSKLTIAFSCSTIETSIESKHASSATIQDFVYIGRDITEQQRTKNRQKAQYALTRILSESNSLESVIQKILQAICENLGWDVGELWMPVTNEEETRFEQKKSQKNSRFCPWNLAVQLQKLLFCGGWGFGKE